MQPEARSCIHSLLQTVKELKDMEFIDVHYLEGGVKAWKDAGHPLELPREDSEGKKYSPF